MMEQPRKISSEEKLLHVIEKPNNIDKLNLSKKNNLPKKKTRGKISFKKFTLRSLNKILIVVGVLAAATIAFSFVDEDRTLQNRFKDLLATIEREPFDLDKKRESIPDSETYVLNTRKNNPFHILPFVKKQKVKVITKIDLKLVGILWSDNPQAIIEDSISKKNYLLFVGDTVEKFLVKEITQNEVKLVSETEEKILR